MRIIFTSTGGDLKTKDSSVIVDKTSTKSTFKGVYGQPIATYMKEYRIRQAAILLRRNNDTVADIANEVGYENQSKFATAFQKIMEVSPATYKVFSFSRKNI